MKFFYEILRQWIFRMVNDIVNRTEMMHCFQNIINRDAVSGFNRIGFKDQPCLFFRQGAAFPPY